MLGIAFDRYDVNRFRLMRMHVDRKSEIARQIAADLMPRSARVIAAHHVPVLLHEQRVRTRRMHRDPMHAVTDLGVRVRNILRVQPAIDRLPRFSPSSVRNAPAAEIAMEIRSGLFGSRRMVCKHIPPAPGCHFGPVSLPRSPANSCQDFPPSFDWNNAASSTPA